MAESEAAVCNLALLKFAQSADVIYLTHPEEGSKPRNDVLAAATKIVASSFA